MGIRYLDGTRLQRIFIAAANWVNARREHLNAINVFPIPDGDTGTNMAATLTYGVDGIAHLEHPSLDEVRRILGRTVLIGAQGNSGFILAQFMRGFLDGIAAGTRRIHREELGAACQNGFRRAYEAVLEPVEGTILTVMREWARTVEALSAELRDLGEILTGALERARAALAETREQMPLLREHEVVDAGAQGFVHMLEGINEFIRKGAVHPGRPPALERTPASIVDAAAQAGEIGNRYCTQALLEEPTCGVAELRALLQDLGDSLIVSGGSDLLKVHLHTDDPEELFTLLDGYGTLLQTHAEDMQSQTEAVAGQRRSMRRRAARGEVAIVMDSTCDLDPDVAATAGIGIVPCYVTFGEDRYRDRVELDTTRFYEMCATRAEHPLSSSPSLADFQTVYDEALTTHDHVLSLCLTSKMSGVYQVGAQAARELDPERITVVDTEVFSLGLGYMGLQLARRANEGAAVPELLHHLQEMREHSRLYCMTDTLEYVIRGGRVGKLRGFVGKTLGLLPVLSLQSGRLEPVGAARGAERGMADILRRLDDEIPEGMPVCGVVGHGGNPGMAGKIGAEFERRYNPVEMVYLEIGPAVGVHAGPGVWGIFYIAADTL